MDTRSPSNNYPLDDNLTNMDLDDKFGRMFTVSSFSSFAELNASVKQFEQVPRYFTPIPPLKRKLAQCFAFVSPIAIHI
ncbi:unnamed protein product [Schistocephalus solidus]|uniref:Ovule protein n=1 Tax=Schistocephalus solidus TaxID=70667 RepID=A0A183TI24_SCHSO|nr:unnamed protein product [Schistocephalus solidus]